MDWLLRFLNPYKAEGGLVRILARSCFQVTRAAAKCWRGTGRTVSCCNCSGELGGPKSKDEKRCGARGRHSGPRLSPLDAMEKHWAYRGVDAGLATFGVLVGSNLVGSNLVIVKPCKSSVDTPIRPMFPLRPTETVLQFLVLA